jgi:sterol desaturase/sphingolipid hydroxylase (fatty acid hydroxylase superfamily)
MMADRSEWTTVFERFPTGRVPITRSVGVFVHDWARPAEGHPRLFDHPAFELLTTARPRVVAAVYTIAAITMLEESVRSGLTLAAIAGWGLIGVAAWTLTEYLMHRYAFHFVPRTRLGVALAYLSHGVHHAYPRDPERLVMPLVVSAPIAAALLAAGRLLAGASASPFLAGFAAGYLAYDLIHYHLHQHESTVGVFRWLRRYHLQHHYSAPDRQFGVSTPLWDYVFRTGR